MSKRFDFAPHGVGCMFTYPGGRMDISAIMEQDYPNLHYFYYESTFIIYRWTADTPEADPIEYEKCVEYFDNLLPES